MLGARSLPSSATHQTILAPWVCGVGTRLVAIMHHTCGMQVRDYPEDTVYVEYVMFCA